jgi:site-specific DNA recombinase
VLLEEARIVQRMFQRIGVDRGSINDVCRMLKAEGIPTRKGRNTWSHATVRNMLRNPAYKGAAVYGRTQKGPVRSPLRPRRGAPAFPRRGKSVYAVDPEHWIHVPVPRIVSDDLFDAVQAQINENRRRMRRRQEGARWLLQGLTVCKCCDYSYYGKATATRSNGTRYKYAYYRCSGSDRYRFEGVRTCNNRMVRKDMLENAVWKEIENLLSDPHHLRTEFERRAARSNSKEGSACRARIHKLRRAIKRLIDSYAEGLIEKSEFEPRIRDQRARLVRMQKTEEQAQEIEQAQRQMQLVVGRIEAFAEQVDKGLAAMDWKGKRDLVRCLVKQVEVDRKEVTVCFRVEPAPFAQAPGDPGFVQHRSVRRRAHRCTLGHAAWPDRPSSTGAASPDAGIPASCLR